MATCDCKPGGGECTCRAAYVDKHRWPQIEAETPRMLILSTRHLPVPLLSQLDSLDVVGAMRLRYGYLMAVPTPDRIDALASLVPDPLPAVWNLALGSGCAWVMFDHGGPVMIDLRVYHD